MQRYYCCVCRKKVFAPFFRKVTKSNVKPWKEFLEEILQEGTPFKVGSRLCSRHFGSMQAEMPSLTKTSPDSPDDLKLQGVPLKKKRRRGRPRKIKREEPSDSDDYEPPMEEDEEDPAHHAAAVVTVLSSSHRTEDDDDDDDEDEDDVQFGVPHPYHLQQQQQQQQQQLYADANDNRIPRTDRHLRSTSHPPAVVTVPYDPSDSRQWLDRLLDMDLVMSLAQQWVISHSVDPQCFDCWLRQRFDLPRRSTGHHGMPAVSLDSRRSSSASDGSVIAPLGPFGPADDMMTDPLVTSEQLRTAAAISSLGSSASGIPLLPN